MLSLCTHSPEADTASTPGHPADHPTAPSHFTEVLTGNVSHLAPPYVLDSTENRRRRERRRAAHLATSGIDTRPKHIHGIRVPAAT
ncbi:hypothetical protein SVIOM74S_00270 [Streptomyces violarus]